MGIVFLRFAVCCLGGWCGIGGGGKVREGANGVEGEMMGVKGGGRVGGIGGGIWGCGMVVKGAGVEDGEGGRGGRGTGMGG